MKVCYIIGAADTKDVQINPREQDFVIAADGGYAKLQQLGVEADLILGDFDSLGYVPDAPNVLTHPIEKDDTDMMLAAKEGLSRGFDTFVLVGGVGGKRYDHTIANLQTLGFLSENGCRAYLLGGGAVYTVINNGTLTLPARDSGTVSVFCHGSVARGVLIEGLYYTYDGTLTCNDPTAVSNKFCGKEARISVEDGALLIVWQESDFEVRNL